MTFQNPNGERSPSLTSFLPWHQEDPLSFLFPSSALQQLPGAPPGFCTVPVPSPGSSYYLCVPTKLQAQSFASVGNPKILEWKPATSDSRWHCETTIRGKQNHTAILCRIRTYSKSASPRRVVDRSCPPRHVCYCGLSPPCSNMVLRLAVQA